MRFSRACAAVVWLSCVGFSVLAFEGRVVGITDGDTITVLDANKQQHKIRLSGADAPESGQEFGAKSKLYLSGLVFGKQVSIPGTKKDGYGRTVSPVIRVDDGLDAGLEQVKAGFAWHYKKYQSEQSVIDRYRYTAAEINARSEKLGLWQQADPVRPDLYRHAGKTQALLHVDQHCPCSTSAICTGPKGGKYCVSDSGKKKYTP